MQSVLAFWPTMTSSGLVGSGDILAAFVDYRSGDIGVAGGNDPLEDAREAFQWLPRGWDATRRGP